MMTARAKAFSKPFTNRHIHRLALTALLAGAWCVVVNPALAQTSSLCALNEQAKGWAAEKESVRAAPENHKVVFENAQVRILEVTVQPGSKEQFHHHQWPSIILVDSRPPYLNYDKNNKVFNSSVQNQGAVDLPMAIRLPAQEEHAIQNLGDKPFHAIRVEYKKLCN